MKRAILLAAGAAVGYVLGAKAGRERYDQIVDQMNRLWHDPKLRNKADQASSFVSEKMPTGDSGGSGTTTSSTSSTGSTAAGAATQATSTGAGATDTGATGGLGGGSRTTGTAGPGAGGA